MRVLEGYFGRVWPRFLVLWTRDSKKGQKWSIFGVSRGGAGEPGFWALFFLAFGLGFFGQTFRKFWVFWGNCHQKRSKHLHCAQLILSILGWGAQCKGARLVPAGLRFRRNYSDFGCPDRQNKANLLLYRPNRGFRSIFPNT